MKKIVSLFLILILMFLACVTANAQENTESFVPAGIVRFSSIESSTLSFSVSVDGSANIQYSVFLKSDAEPVVVKMYIEKKVLGFFWNQDELDKRNIMPPVDWDDLLKPEYKGLITFGNPKTCGTGKLIVNTVVQIRGKDEAMKYFKELDKNVFYYTPHGVQPAYMVADKEAIIGIGFMHDILRKMITEDKDYLGMTTPISGTSCEIGATAIVKSAKNIENAKKFIEFALSPECVNLAHENNSYQMVLIDNAEPVKTAINTGLDKIETIDFDYEDATKNGESYCDEFIKTIRNDSRVHYK